MNLVIGWFGIGRISRTPVVAILLLPFVLCISLSGCSDEVIMPSAGQLLEFENAGPMRPTVDMNRLVKAKIGGGPYKVVNGDVLELTMPALLRAVTYEQAAGADGSVPYMCRISESGTIDLPLVGQINVSGMTLAQIESAVIGAYHPAYSVSRPYVYVHVAEHRTAQVSVTGAVNKPGLYSLRSDQMSLVALLMEAGGIIDEGAAVIRIIHADNQSASDDQTAIQNVQKSFDQQTKSPRVPQLKFTSDESESNKVAVQLTFEPSSSSNTVGTLRVTRGPIVLLVERLDIASKEDRLLLLDKLARREPRASITDANAKLCALADQVKQAATVYNNTQRDVPIKSSGSSTNAKPGFFEQDSIREHITQGKSQLSGTDVNYLLSPPPAPRRFSHGGAGNDVANDNMTLYARIGFYANTTGKDSAHSDPSKQEPTHPYAWAKTENPRITGPAAAENPQELVLPIKGLNVPFTDVMLHDGDTVIVERLAEPLFSVMGLVNRGGNFPYPPDVQFNLMQALAFAGGLNDTAEPRYATIYRLKPDGTVVHIVFQVAKIDKSSRPDAAFNVRIKPGDVVIVERTPRTETKLFLDRVFNVNFGAYVPVWR